ncbi:nudix domain-containing protein [Diaporthe amygdali]|uniref:nudix domain-containing protein n=1 Tax=Phomopsis amygdali TaxID=1214568 RepID=UPI0022FF04D1|nr:nudix domain-containing protein [Diaporthe amygdali]KAJ0123301.1 nudix domain-containing protein [Diaporthe amygdali]
MFKGKSPSFVENTRACPPHESIPKSFNINTTHNTRRQRKPLDVVAFDNAMACAKSTDFCICAGTVTFKGRGEDSRVLVILNEKYTQDLWQLPKGRKNIGEDALCNTAIRETYEETGYKVQLLSKNILTRATMAKGRKDPGPIFEAQSAEPIAMVHYTEPFPGLAGSPVTKVCFFFVATVRDDAPPAPNTQDVDEVLEAYWLTCADAMERLTFAAERRALEIAMCYL